MAGENYLTRFRDLLIEAGEFTAEQIATIMRIARAHAGGKGKAQSQAQKGQPGVAENTGDLTAGELVNGYTDIDRTELLASGEDIMGNLALIGQLTFAEGGVCQVQIFPHVGSYQHPAWGDIRITQQFLGDITKNFTDKVYQQELPLTVDCEHESKLSGAVGWISAITDKGADGLWATIELNDRGKELLARDAYRYFSPEFYEHWTDPATGKSFSNVLIGGALTNRPFFKGMDAVVLMTEDGPYLMTEPPKDVEDPNTFAEKTEEGKQFPSSAYLVVPDPNTPSTWKLRIWETPESKVTVAQLGRAAAALSPGGFRGNPVQLTPEERSSAMAKLRALYKAQNVADDAMPPHVKASETEDPSPEGEPEGEGAHEEDNPMGMTEDEARAFSELQNRLTVFETKQGELVALNESLTTRLSEAQGTIASMQVSGKAREMREFVRQNSLGFAGSEDESVGRLMKLSEVMPAEEFTDYLGERRAMHERLAASEALTKQFSRPVGPVQPGGEFETFVSRAMAEGMTRPLALAKVAEEHPDLYAKYDAAEMARQKRGE
jgi:hypothetical protein